MARLADIAPAAPESWEKKCYLTLDVDWAPDEAVNFCLSLMDQANATATVFLTHGAPWLDAIREDERLEWGVHPNFESTLPTEQDGESSSVLIQRVLDETAEWAPTTQLIRPHGLMTAGRWLPIYSENGFTHLSSIYPRLQHVEPYDEYNGIVQVPIHWSDTGHLYLNRRGVSAAGEIDTRMSEDVFTVLLFHPIHVFLNTESIAHYESARSVMEHRNHSLEDLRSSRGSVLPAFLRALEWVSR